MAEKKENAGKTGKTVTVLPPAFLAGAAALVFFSAMMLLSIYQAEASAGAPSRLARISATLRPRRLATMRGDC